MRKILYRFVTPFVSLLRQGIEPRQLAWAIAIGAGVGVFPVLGTTTVLCTLAAVTARLNLVAIHAVHYAVTPLQLLLIIPFVRAGERVVGAPVQPLTLTEGLALIERGVIAAIVALSDAIVHAVIGWLVIMPLAIAVTYFTSAWLLARLHARSTTGTAPVLSSPARPS